MFLTNTWFDRLMLLGCSWNNILPTLFTGLLVPYLRTVLHASYYHVALVLICMSFSSSVACLLRSHTLKFDPSFNYNFLFLVIGSTGLMIGASMLLSSIRFWWDVEDNGKMAVTIGVITLLCGMTEFSRKLCEFLIHSIYLKYDSNRNLVDIWNQVLGMVIGGAILWVPINSLEDIHIPFAFANAINLLFVAFAVLVLIRARINSSDSKNKETSDKTSTQKVTSNEELLSLIKRTSSPWNCFLSFSLLVFSMSKIFFNFLTDCYVWRRKSTSENPEIDAYYMRDAIHVFTYALALGVVVYLIFHFSVARQQAKSIASSFALFLGAPFMGIMVAAFFLLEFMTSIPAFTSAFILLGISKLYDSLMEVLEKKLKSNMVRFSTPPETKDSTETLSGNSSASEFFIQHYSRFLELVGSCIGILVSSMVLELLNYSILLMIHTGLAICCLLFVLLSLFRYPGFLSRTYANMELQGFLNKNKNSNLPPIERLVKSRDKSIILFKRPSNFA